MPSLPYAISAYERRSGRLPPFVLRNLYVEAVPQEGGKPVLIQRGGLTEPRVLGAGRVRGVFRQAGTFDGQELAVVGNTLFIGGAAVGTIAGNDLVRFASSGFQVAIAGGGVLHVTDGVTVTVPAFPDDAPVSDVAFLSGLFLASRRGTGQFYYSAVLDATSWGGADFYTAEVAPDGIVALQLLTDEVWVFGGQSVEIWAANGAGNPNDPLSRQQGRVYDRGCRSRDSVVRFDNSVVWVGDDGIVYAGSAAPVRISNHGIEEIIGTQMALNAWTFTKDGHKFYLLHTPTGSYGFDAATREWSEFASYGSANFRGWVGYEFDGEVYAGDRDSGTIWRLCDDALTDDGLQIERTFTAQAPMMGKPVQGLTLELDATVGLVDDLAANPLVEMRYSRDLGRTWSEPRVIEAGRTGQYRRRMIWNRLGLIDVPGRVFEFRCTDPCTLSVAGVYLNGTDGTAGNPGRQR